MEKDEGEWGMPPIEDVRNTVRYELYLSQTPSEGLIDKYKKHVASIIPNQKDRVKFSLKKNEKYTNLLYGRLKFNQNIEQEWLIVYILYQLSLHDRDLVIRVHDNDGDTLLIEAAEHLPLWLESSKSKNRVFIHAGNLHIIPENINLRQLQDNYKCQFNSSSSSASSSQANVVVRSIAQVSAQFIRDMNSAGDGGDYLIAGGSRGKGGDSKRVNTLAEPSIQNAIRAQLSGLPDTELWLQKKLKQLDEIISEKSCEDKLELQKKFNESLSLASVMEMDDDELRTSPISTLSPGQSSQSSLSSTTSSSSWLSEQQDD